MRPVLAAASLVAIFGSSAAAAQLGRSEGLPFGLDKFQWDMTAARVSAMLPALAPKEPKPDRAAHDTSDLFVGPYAWRSCRFDVGFSFVENSLKYIHLYPRDDATNCEYDIRNELYARLGGPSWRYEDADTIADYSPEKISLSEAEKVIIPITH